MCIYQHGHGVHDGGGQQPQHVRQQQQGGVASVQRGEGLVEVGGVGDGLGDVQLGRDGAEAGLGGHPHVVHQQRVHQIHGRQPHRDVKLEEEAINNLIFKRTKAQIICFIYRTILNVQLFRWRMTGPATNTAPSSIVIVSQ